MTRNTVSGSGPKEPAKGRNRDGGSKENLIRLLNSERMAQQFKHNRVCHGTARGFTSNCIFWFLRDLKLAAEENQTTPCSAFFFDYTISVQVYAS